VEPLIISWGWESENLGSSRFLDYLEWTGTMDISSYFSAPKAVNFVQIYVLGKNRSRCHELCANTQTEISDLTGFESFHPTSSTFIAQMTANPIPATIDINLLK